MTVLYRPVENVLASDRVSRQYNENIHDIEKRICLLRRAQSNGKSNKNRLFFKIKYSQI